MQHVCFPLIFLNIIFDKTWNNILLYFDKRDKENVSIIKVFK